LKSSAGGGDFEVFVEGADGFADVPKGDPFSWIEFTMEGCEVPIGTENTEALEDGSKEL
jgi:hypothetical protein